MSRQALPPVQVRSRKSVERAIQGSIEVIREAGWAGFTMPAVSRKAGVSVPLLHRRFGGKEELFLAAQESVLQRMESETTAGFSGDQWDDLSAAQAIDLASEALARVMFRHALLLRAFNERGATDERVRERAEHTLRLKYRLFSERILQFADEITLESPQVGVGVCFASLIASLNHEAKHGDLHSTAGEWDRLVAELARASRRYLLGAPTPLPDLGQIAHPSLDRPVPGDGTRDRLIASGVDLLAEGNYGDVTAAAVSHRAGFTVGALYTYFENKEELLLAVEAQALTRLLDDAVSLFGAIPAATDEERVAAAVAATVILIEANPAAARVLIARRPAPATTEQVSRTIDEVKRLFGDPVCFLVVYSALTEYIPHDAYLTPSISPERFRAEQARFCSQYLA